MAKINKEKQAAMPQKLLLELFDYNGETGGWFNKTNRNSRARKGEVAGYVNKMGYVQISISGYTYLAHRLAWTITHGDYPDGEQPFIDHINGKRDDNRIANLRDSSGAENNRNRQMSSDNTSGIVGVRRAYAWNGNKTKLNWYWMATWCDENGKKRSKKFNIQKLGEGEARQMAINHRAEQLRLLELNHGIVYSERHGT